MATNGIGELRESTLHAELKEWYSRPGDEFEITVSGSVIDIVRGDRLIEIQTKNFNPLRTKLEKLLPEYEVRVVHPIGLERWIRRVTAEDKPVTRRKSPKRGRVEDLFAELVSLPQFVAHPNFSLEVLLIQEEIIWRDDGKGSWRRKRWSVADHQLIQVLDQFVFESAADYGRLLPGRADDLLLAQDRRDRECGQRGPV
jgi:hypothetical protein